MMLGLLMIRGGSRALDLINDSQEAFTLLFVHLLE